MISIHALLAESDPDRAQRRHKPRRNFNPRSPCGERLEGYRGGRGSVGFQSTLSLRRATEGQENDAPIRPIISIHALLAESDPTSVPRRKPLAQFQSTLSLRRATQNYGFAGRRFVISIHALLAESDTGWMRFSHRQPNFNPRSPCGERQQIPPNWPYRFCLKCQFKDGEKSKKAKGSASAQASSPAYEKNKVRIPWGDFECFRFAPIK